MTLVGADLHTREQSVVTLCRTTGELQELRIRHEGDEVERFCAALPHKGRAAGRAATDHGAARAGNFRPSAAAAVLDAPAAGSAARLNGPLWAAVPLRSIIPIDAVRATFLPSMEAEGRERPRKDFVVDLNPDRAAEGRDRPRKHFAVDLTPDLDSGGECARESNA